MSQRNWLTERLNAYVPSNDHERDMQRRMQQFVAQHPRCFERSLQVGHVTGSAWVVNPARTHVLLLFHAKLQRWLQPGGHSDGDGNTLEVARRETTEETGVPLSAIRTVSTDIFDLDIHVIPTRGDEPEHEHFDVRFMLEIADNALLSVSQESRAARWETLDGVRACNSETSILRMVEKTRGFL